MTQTAEMSVADDAVLQEMGVVVEAAAGRFVVEHGGARFHAARAVSCLVEPQVGDHVLFAGRPSSALFVLAVLERPGSDSVVLRAPGDVSLALDAGRFTVAAKEGVTLLTPAELTAHAGELGVKAKRGKVLLGDIEVVARHLLQHVESVKQVSERVERFATSVIDRVKQSYRFIEEMDQLRAGRVEHVAEESMRIKGEHTLVQANHLVKLDGEQIHLG